MRPYSRNVSVEGYVQFADNKGGLCLHSDKEHPLVFSQQTFWMGEELTVSQQINYNDVW